jgi:hypothetical protein
MDFSDVTSTLISPSISPNTNPFLASNLDPSLDLLTNKFTGNGDSSYQLNDLTFLNLQDSVKPNDPQTQAKLFNSPSIEETTFGDPLLGTQLVTSLSANGELTTAQTASIRINAGGEAYTDTQGNQYSPTNPPFEQGQDGRISLEAEQFHNQVSAGDHEWTLVSDSQASGGGAMETPDLGIGHNTGYVDTSPRLDYEINFSQTGQHYVWVLGRAGGNKIGSSDSLHIGLDGQAVDTSDRLSDFEAEFGWSNDTMDGAPAVIDITSTGVHTLNLWMREDGFIVDQVILSPDPDFDPMQVPDTPKAFEQGQDGLVSLEAEQFHNQVTPGDHEWTLVSDSNASGGEAMYTALDNGTNYNTDYADNSPRLDYEINFTQIGQHYVWVLGRAAGDRISTSDSLHVGLDGQEIKTADRIKGFKGDFGWSNGTMDGAPAVLNITSTGVQTLNLWMREDGFMVDQVILATAPNFDPLSTSGGGDPNPNPGTGDGGSDPTPDSQPNPGTDGSSSNLVLPREQPAANVSYDDPAFVEDAWSQSWGAGSGRAPGNLFWENVDKYQDQEFMEKVNRVAADHEKKGRVPVVGLQLWRDTFRKSQPGGSQSDEPGHEEWVKWVEARPQYQGVNKNGEDFGWGYVSPLMPLDPKDYPKGFQGDTAYYADWQADRLGRLAGATGINGYMFSDFFDSHPHSGLDNYFNERIIDDFEQKTGIQLSGKSLTQQADEIRSQHYQEWIDYWADGWAYNWEAIVREIGNHTGEEAWLVNQTSFTPATMRRIGAVDARAIMERVSPDNLLFLVQEIQGFMIKGLPLPESIESANIGLFAAREPQARYGQIVMSSERRYWETVQELWPKLSEEAREELGWKRLKRTWLESGWTHVATRQGDIRRAAEAWERSYNNRGDTNENWVKLLRDVDPTRPFGPALYYSVAIERAVEQEAGASSNQITSSYLGEHLRPVTDLKEAGVPFNYYVSDIALDELQGDIRPSAWIIPDRYRDGKDLLPKEEREALNAIAPILSEEEAQNMEHPLSFSTDQNRTITGFGFYDQNDRLIITASDQIQFGETNSNLEAADTTVKLKLSDGNYVARELLTGEEIKFKVSSGSGKFETKIDRWDTKVFAITPIS